MRWENGEPLVQIPLKGGPGTQGEGGSPYWHIHRADLHRGLLAAAEEAGCAVFLNSRVVSIDPETGTLTTASGGRFKGELIVASDGLKSHAREIVAGRESKPVPTGQMAYRVTLPVNVLDDIEGLEDVIGIPGNNHWLGPRGTVLSYVLEGGEKGRLVNFVFTCDAEGFMPDGIDQRPGDLEVVRKRFADWDPRIGRMLGRVGSVLEWRVRPPFPFSSPCKFSWRSRGRNETDEKLVVYTRPPPILDPSLGKALFDRRRRTRNDALSSPRRGNGHRRRCYPIWSPFALFAIAIPLALFQPHLTRSPSSI